MGGGGSIDTFDRLKKTLIIDETSNDEEDLIWTLWFLPILNRISFSFFFLVISDRFYSSCLRTHNNYYADRNVIITKSTCVYRAVILSSLVRDTNCTRVSCTKNAVELFSSSWDSCSERDVCGARIIRYYLFRFYSHRKSILYNILSTIVPSSN